MKVAYVLPAVFAAGVFVGALFVLARPPRSPATFSGANAASVESEIAARAATATGDDLRTAISTRKNTEAEPSPTRREVPAASSESLDLAANQVSDLHSALLASEEERRKLERSLALCEHPEESVIGTMLRLPETGTLSDDALRWLRDTLHDVPVRLLPGEAKGLTDHVMPLTGIDRGEAVIAWLGPVRVLQSLDEHQVLELARRYGDEDFVALFGRLPPRRE